MTGGFIVGGLCSCRWVAVVGAIAATQTIETRNRRLEDIAP